MKKGHFHPLTIFIQEATEIFKNLGFTVAEGPELETEWFNFDFLRVPADHPVRDEQDTFWVLSEGKLKVLRTHMTAVQGRIMKQAEPPCRFVMPGRVFRNETTDATHESILYQLDGFAIDKDITMTDLIGTLDHFLKKILSPDTKIQLRPHHYPFVEPGMDVAIPWKDKWLEILGSGMIHPQVLENMKIDPQKWQGFAFGIGLERLAMLKYGISDIRKFLRNDMRLNKQF
jgi:phenylalanyl-tRNA synthetase alpha chain